MQSGNAEPLQGLPPLNYGICGQIIMQLSRPRSDHHVICDIEAVALWNEATSGHKDAREGSRDTRDWHLSALHDNIATSSSWREKEIDVRKYIIGVCMSATWPSEQLDIRKQ